MKTYIGVKVIKAEPMDHDTFLNQFRDGAGMEENAHGYHVEYPDGYHSWSPQHVFESAYREFTRAEEELLWPPTNPPERKFIEG